MAHQEIAKIKHAGWRQGSVFNLRDSIPPLANGLYLLVSQDCDIIHDSFDDEPSAEILLLQPISNPDGNLTFGKNPRKIHFNLKDEKFYECAIKNRFFIDRKLLAETTPSHELTPNTKTLNYLIGWITKKYNRDAFPDEFNRRIKNKKKLQKILEKEGEKIIGLFIRLNTENELEEKDIYKVDLMMIGDLENNSSNQVDIRFHLNQTLERIVKIIEENKGIQVLEDYSTRFLDELTVAEYMNMMKWDFDFLSYRDFPEGKILYD